MDLRVFHFFTTFESSISEQFRVDAKCEDQLLQNQRHG